MPNHEIRSGEDHVSTDIFEQDLEILKEEGEAAKAEFRNALGTRVKSLQWRSRIASGALSDHLAHEARSADLVITSIAFFDFFRRVIAGEWIAADERSGCDTLRRKTGDRTEANSATTTADHRAGDPAAP